MQRISGNLSGTTAVSRGSSESEDLMTVETFPIEAGHAEQHFEYHEPVLAGDVLTAQTRPGKTWEREGRRGGKLHFSESITSQVWPGDTLTARATVEALRHEGGEDFADLEVVTTNQSGQEVVSGYASARLDS